jgi:aspartate aminotransferase/aminotransferase
MMRACRASAGCWWSIEMTVPPRPAAQRALSMPRSAIREIMALAAGRPEVIHLEVGDPDLDTPPHVSAALGAAALSGATHYAPNAGLPTLRAAVAARVTARTGREVAAERVVVTAGAVNALFASLLAVLDPGDEVLLPDPGWPNYESIAHLAGATCRHYPMPAARSFLPDPAEIRALAGPRTKALLLNTPGNPTGAVFPAELMAGLADLARETGLYLVSDEIYEDMVFEGAHVSIGSLDLADRAFLISGFSKSYAMTGWRLGWVVCPPGLSPVVAGLLEPVISCAPTMIQMAGEVALAGPQESVAKMAELFRRRRDVLAEVLGQSPLLPVLPHGAFYAFLDIGASGLGSLDFARAALAEAAVAVVPGISFGPSSDRFVRVALTVPEDTLREGLGRLKAMVERRAA